MKRLFKILCLLMLAELPFNAIAQQFEGQPVTMKIKVNTPKDEHEESPRMPAAPILVYQDGHVFTFNPAFNGCIVKLASNDTAVFVTAVGATGIISLPETFIGYYELQLFIGTATYCAIIELPNNSEN